MCDARERPAADAALAVPALVERLFAADDGAVRSACAASQPLPPSLLRRVLEHTLQELRARGWEAEDLAWHAELLRTGPLSKRAPLGLRYFLVDGVLAALRGELGGGEAGDGGPLLPLLEPFFAVLGAASDDKEVCLASRLPRLRAVPRRRPHAPSTLLGSGAACRITSLSRCSAATTTRARGTT